MATDLPQLPLCPAPHQSTDQKVNEQSNQLPLPSCDNNTYPHHSPHKTENQVEPFMVKESHDDSINTSHPIIQSPDAHAQLLHQLVEADSLCSSNQNLEDATLKIEPKAKEADPTEPPLPDQQHKTNIEAESGSTNQPHITATPLVQPITESPDCELTLEVKEDKKDELATQETVEVDQSSVVEDNKEAEKDRPADALFGSNIEKQEEECVDQFVPNIPIKESEWVVKEKEIVEVSLVEAATDKTIEPTAEDKKEKGDDKGTLSETSKDASVIEPPKDSEKEAELNVLHVSSGEACSERNEGDDCSVKDVGEDKGEMEDDEKLPLHETNRDADEEGKLGVKEKENIEGEESGVKDGETMIKENKPGVTKESQKEKEMDELEEKEKQSVDDKERKIESKNIPKEGGAAKQSPKQSNNIIAKVKQSFLKAKKAIIGKSSTPKTVSTETKGEIKVK